MVRFYKNGLFVLASIVLGNQLFAQDFGWAIHSGGASSDYGREVVMDGDENVYVAGTFTGAVDFDPGAATTTISPLGASDAFFQKFDAQGNLLWVKTIGGAAGSVFISSIVLDDDGAIIISGQFADGPVDFDPGTGSALLTESTQFGNDGFVLKLTSNGDFVWVKQFDSSQHVEMRAVNIANDGLYIVGMFEGTIDLDPGAGVVNFTNVISYDCFIAKLDESGNYELGTTITNGYCFALGSEFNRSTNRLHIIGGFNNSLDFDPGAGTHSITQTGVLDGFVLQLNDQLEFQWVNTFGGVDMNVSPLDICHDNFGDLFIAGTYNSNDYSPGGSVDFNAPSGGSAELANLGNEEAFILKLDGTTGSYEWVKGLSTSLTQKPAAIGVDGNGDIYVSGIYSGTTDFDPSPAATVDRVADYYDAFLLKLNTLGEYVNVQTYGGPSAFAGVNDIDVNAAGTVVSTGFFFETVDFDPGAATFNITTSGSHDSYVLKLDGENAELKDFKETGILLYPNPSSTNVTIICDDAVLKVELLDLTGKPVRTVQDQTVEVSDLTSGIYIVKATTSNGILQERLVVE